MFTDETYQRELFWISGTIALLQLQGFSQDNPDIHTLICKGLGSAYFHTEKHLLKVFFSYPVLWSAKLDAIAKFICANLPDGWTWHPMFIIYIFNCLILIYQPHDALHCGHQCFIGLYKRSNKIQMQMLQISSTLSFSDSRMIL